MPRRTAPVVPAERSTRDVILDAAERRFASHGFAGVSVREIASDAGLKNQASLYHHFKHKRALYEAVLARGIEPLVAILAERAAMAGETDPRTPLGRFVEDVFVDRSLDYLIQHPHVPILIQRAGLDDARFLRATLPKLVRSIWTQGQVILAGTEPTGDPDELPHVAIGLYLLIFGYFTNLGLLEVVLPDDPLGPAALRRQRVFLRRAVARLVSPETPPDSKARRR